MKRIVDILMKRDHVTKEEAENILKNVREEIQEVISIGGDYTEVEDIVMSELGLEMDYIDELL